MAAGPADASHEDKLPVTLPVTGPPAAGPPAAAAAEHPLPSYPLPSYPLPSYPLPSYPLPNRLFRACPLRNYWRCWRPTGS